MVFGVSTLQDDRLTIEQTEDRGAVAMTKRRVKAGNDSDDGS